MDWQYFLVYPSNFNSQDTTVDVNICGFTTPQSVYNGTIAVNNQLSFYNTYLPNHQVASQLTGSYTVSAHGLKPLSQHNFYVDGKEITTGITQISANDPSISPAPNGLYTDKSGSLAFVVKRPVKYITDPSVKIVPENAVGWVILANYNMTKTTVELKSGTSSYAKKIENQKIPN
jgi:hypothetical protein